MYFVTQLANELNINLEDVMLNNMEKLKARLKANKIKGDGEQR
jgi:hypothetical protein